MPRSINFLFIFLLISCKSDGKQKNHDGEDYIIESPLSQNQKVLNLDRDAQIFARNDEFEKADKLFVEALEIEPQNYVILNNYGLSQSIQMKFDSAIQLLEKSYRLSDSTYQVAASNLSKAYFAKREFEKGVNVATYALENSKNQKLNYTLYIHRIANYAGLRDCRRSNEDIKLIINEFNDQSDFEKQLKQIQKIFSHFCS